MTRKGIGILLAGMFMSLSLNAVPARGEHVRVTLKGYDGEALTVTSKEPYSPRQTCGECHEYDQITNGYHFQQGRTDGSGKIVISDNFNPKKPWILSAGMFGKW